jgi:hypothetical protein
MGAGGACQSHDGVAMDTHQAFGLTHAVAVVEVRQGFE